MGFGWGAEGLGFRVCRVYGRHTMDMSEGVSRGTLGIEDSAQSLGLHPELQANIRDQP